MTTGKQKRLSVHIRNLFIFTIYPKYVGLIKMQGNLLMKMTLKLPNLNGLLCQLASTYIFIRYKESWDREMKHTKNLQKHYSSKILSWY